MGDQTAAIRSAEDNDRMREEIIENTNEHQFLGAGAGAGKTTVLVDHYFYLLEEGIRPDQLIAVTFTEKAAAEMKRRLRTKCRKRAGAARQNGGPTDESRKWERIQHELEAAPITTIHGLCSRLLRENALVAGLDPDFVVLDEIEAQMLLDEVVRQTSVSRLGQHDTAKELVVDLGYSEAVKTITRLVQDRVNAAEVLGDPRYDDVLSLMEHWAEVADKLRVQAVTELLSDDVWIEACQLVRADQDPPKPSDCKLEIKRLEVRNCLENVCSCRADASDQHRDGGSQHAFSVNVSGATELGDLAEKMRALGTAGNVGSAKVWGEEGRSAMRSALRVFLNSDGLLQQVVDTCNALQPGTAEECTCAHSTCALITEVKASLAAYRGAKDARSALDFEDLLELTRDLWSEHPDVLQRVRGSIAHLMVDEFQDTNTLQKQVLWPLITGESYDPDGVVTLPDDGPRLFVVGDAKQSIYRFRNADVTVVSSTRMEMAGENARDNELTRNFRSTEHLIDVYNELFVSPEVMGTEASEVYETCYSEMTATRANPPAEQAPVEVHLLTEEYASAEEENAKLSEMREREAEWLGSRLVRLLVSEECLVQRGEGEDVCFEAAKPGDIAILFRSMKDIATYERALREVNLPYYLVVGRGFFQAQEVQDVIQALRAIENDLDDIAMVGTLRSPLFGVSDETLYWLGQMGPGAWWWRVQKAVRSDQDEDTQEIVGHIDETQHVRLQSAATLLRDLRSQKNRLSLSELLQALLDRTGYPAVIVSQFGGKQMVSNVRKLVELAGEFEATRSMLGQANLGDFIEHLKRLTAEEVREGQAAVEDEAGNSIKLITYHSAKGLEWPIVVVPDLCRGKGGGGSAPRYRFHRDIGLVVSTTYLRQDQGGREASYWPPMGRLIKNLNESEEEAERRRLFYVAATRAEQRLVLSGVARLASGGNMHGSDDKGPLTWINAALSNALWADGGNEPGQKWWRWENGELVQVTDVLQPRRVYQPGEVTDASAIEIAADKLDKQIKPVAQAGDDQRRFTATELSLYNYCPKLYELQRVLGLPALEPSLSSESGAAGLSAMEFGNVIHRVLQLVGAGAHEALDRLVPRDAEVLRLDTLTDRRAAARADAIRAQAGRFIDSPVYQQLFTSENKLRSEAGLTVKLSIDGHPVLIEGKIDALIETPEGQTHLIDYKTGESDAVRHQQYTVQVGLYCHAVKQATGELPVSASLVSLSNGQLDIAELDVHAVTEEAIGAARRAVEGIWRAAFPDREGQCGFCNGSAFCGKGRADRSTG